jgi:hypothetical protein
LTPPLPSAARLARFSIPIGGRLTRAREPGVDFSTALVFDGQ